MKKIIGNIYGKLALACVCTIAGISARADEFKSIYDITDQKQEHSFINSPYAPILFGTLFIVGVYTIYHYWSNGKLKDDMS